MLNVGVLSTWRYFLPGSAGAPRLRKLPTPPVAWAHLCINYPGFMETRTGGNLHLRKVPT